MTENAENNEPILCEICGAKVHVIQHHLKQEHRDVTLDDYTARFPHAPVLSQKAIRMVAERNAKKAVEAAPVATASATGALLYEGGFNVTKRALHEVFKLGRVKAALGNKGNDIPIQLVTAPDDLALYVPDQDPNYIFPIDLLKKLMLGIESNTPTYLWGHAGVGKSSVVEQACAMTGRPMLRIQHTRNTEESHVLGQWTVKDGQTVFELGPLAFCMKYGLTYLADEYDFGMPAVLSLYQPVLEGKALVIKDADVGNRVIKPHPLFRFVATGNTNGTGDETGLYQGTMMQNAANYERFGIVEEVHYMEPQVEIGVVAGQGNIPREEAEKLVNFGTMIREAFANGKIGLPISPRSLIYAARNGKRLANMKTGLQLAYINRLSRVDQEAANEVLKRITL